MERIWLASPLGARKKTQSRQDYRTRSIENAIGNCKEVFTPTRITNPVDGLDLLFTFDAKKDKIYTQNTENMARILRKHPRFAHTLRYDAFMDQMQVRSRERDAWRAFEDHDAIRIQTLISMDFSAFRKVGKDMVYDAIVHVAKENTVDTAIDYVRHIEWDKKQRLEQWLTHTYGTPDDAYHRAVAANWLKGLVKRLIEPGCKFDYVLVLEGPQGSKKSTSLFVLGEIDPKTNWHVETTMSTDTKDFFEQFQGKAIIEFSEGETLSRTEVKKMKAIITTQIDRFRPSYGRVSTDHPRRCVFAMTTNQDQYLKDETGNRRWLPITLRKEEADIEWLRENRDQLFAEAYHRLTAKKETVYEFPKEDTLREQELRRISDPNEERICHWYLHELTDAQRSDGVSVEQVNQNALHAGFTTQGMRRFEEMAIADVLKRVLRLTKKRKMIDGIQSMRWFNDKEIVIDVKDGVDAFEAADAAMRES
jgi:putative DNA primase/helicase